MQCDHALDMKEGRMCALQFCSYHSEDERALSIQWGEKWLMASLQAKDQLLLQPQGMNVVQFILHWYEEKQQYRQGISICNQLISNYPNEVMIEEVSGMWINRYEKALEVEESRDSSISMDCSD